MADPLAKAKQLHNARAARYRQRRKRAAALMTLEIGHYDLLAGDLCDAGLIEWHQQKDKRVVFGVLADTLRKSFKLKRVGDASPNDEDECATLDLMDESTNSDEA